MTPWVVYLNDTGVDYDVAPVHFQSAADWARSNCPTFIDHHVQDVSDVSLSNDYIAQYRFLDMRDVLLFQLRWL